MTFKSKLMLTMGPLVLALVLVGVVSGIITGKLARRPESIWNDNYRSVIAAQRMKESAEQLYDAALFRLLGHPLDQEATRQETESIRTRARDRGAQHHGEG